MRTKIFLAIFSLIIFCISCDKEVFTGVIESSIEQDGKIFIQSNPSAAKIFLGTHNMGQITPDTLVWLRSGDYDITLKLDFYKDTLIRINANDGKVTNVFVDYTTNPGHYGKIACYSIPNGADLYLNNLKMNKKTPYTISGLTPGYYNVKCTFPEFRSDSLKVAVYGGKVSNANLILEDTTKYVSYTTRNSGINDDYLTSIVIDKNNNKWIATVDKGLNKFDSKNWFSYNTNNSLRSSYINCLAIDNQNNLWVGFSNGLMMYNGTNWTDFSGDIQNRFVTAIKFDKVGNGWIGTQKGLVKYDGINWRIYSTSNSGLASDYITCLDIATDGKIWIGTDLAGICVFDGLNSWQVWNMLNMQLGQNLGNVIYSIACDFYGTIWVSHASDDKLGYRGGISQYNGNKWNIASFAGFSNDGVHYIYVDENNAKWFCSVGGLGKFTSANGFSYYSKMYTGLQSNNIVSVALDKSGNLWIATYGGGLSKFKKGNF
ncbi:MAG: PEGA domain-containing protein [Ignavibacteriales bacterium]|nr:PEGA domain-containing protein [Ignavibacteriales bacterium]